MPVYDPAAADACFVDGRPPKDLDAVLTWVRGLYETRQVGPSRLISARQKFGKTLFEIEEDTAAGPRRLIGKLGRTDRAEVLHKALCELRNDGFRPPARFTVSEPVAFVREHGFVLQEKVPGPQATRLILASGESGRTAAVDSARWLAALHSSNLSASSDSFDAHQVLRWAQALTEVQATDARMIRDIADAVLQRLSETATPGVPTHGDFHPSNVFIAGNERVSGIDLDKFAVREPESDIGWFLMQTAVLLFEGGRGSRPAGSPGPRALSL